MTDPYPEPGLDPRLEPAEAEAATPPSDEITRLTRTGVQAAVAALVTWLFTKYGVHIDADLAVKVVFPIVLVLVTGLVHQLSKIPGLGGYIALLNGPRRMVTYHPRDGV
jgi:fatty acid desaturase